ncbi:MAG: MSCRAMM family adhesin SdrC, partial [Psychrosphaera sp.]|nr:MSCRAMM family adhesin SdrC [Psychrosphaera sp.]
RRVLLQGQDLPANPFTVSLEFDSVSYLPQPLEIRARVSGSTQPIEQVEFYSSPTINGPFEIMRKHRGPEYVVNRNFGTHDSGKYLKARAVDVFGNLSESEPLAFTRLHDFFPPAVGISVEGNFVAANTLPNNRPFTVVFTLLDDRSGIDYALLKRNGTLISANIANGEFRFEETNPELGATYVYELSAFDQAGNLSEQSLSVDIVQDSFPVITSVNVPDEIREQTAFSVSFSATDDLGLASIGFEWPGINEKASINKLMQASQSFTLSDPRVTRLTSDIVENLKVVVTDDGGQVTTQLAQVTVKQDLPPQASLLTMGAESIGLYGGKIRLNVSGLALVDDGGVSELTLALMNLTNSPATVTTLCGPVGSQSNVGTCDDTVAQQISLPQLAVANNTARYQLRVTDRLGQADEAGVFSVALTQQPNHIGFVDLGDALLNPTEVRMGIGGTYQVQVVDTVNRAVAQQPLRWWLTDELGNQLLLGEGITDNNGQLALHWPAAAMASGQYRIQAQLTAFNIEMAELAVSVLPGAAVAIEISHIKPLIAGESFELAMRLVDDNHNLVFDNNEQVMDVSINDLGFHFGFANRVQVQPLVNTEGQTIGETARINFTAGVANIEVAGSTVVGRYLADLDLPVLTLAGHDEQLTIRYNLIADGEQYQEQNQLALNVGSGEAYSFSFATVDYSEHPDGIAQLLETDESATVALQLVDSYNNPTSKLIIDGVLVDADLRVIVQSDGAATIDGEIGLASLFLDNGAATFAVSNQLAETVTVSMVETVPTTTLLGESHQLTFNKRPPALIAGQFSVPHNSMDMTLSLMANEALEIDQSSNAMVVLKTNDTTIYGASELTSETEIVFTPTLPFTLNTCYQYDTNDSNLRGIAANDGLLARVSTVCSPHIGIPVPASQYVMEGNEMMLPLFIGPDIETFRLSDGQLSIDGDIRVFDFNTGLIELPMTTDTGVDDGAQVTLTLSGTYKGDPLMVANTISIGVLQLGGDFDLDGLSNGLEQTLSLDPTNNDTDGNGVNDGNEDFDNDGLSNIDELSLGTDIANVDSDGDGISDGDEVNTHGSDPTSTDSDGDGLADGDELAIHGTDPANADTDGDGLNDGDEVNVYATNPTNGDSDADGLLDGDEVNTHNTNPLVADTDGDELSDGDEITVYNTDPTDSDTDDDGLRDGLEVNIH